MSDRFIAADVGTGDAFFLQRDSSTALVDGGQSTGFPRLLHRATNTDAVNILVCTHNDRDHANGILEFLEGGCAADEVWLPATWMEATSRLVDASSEEVESLFSDESEAFPDEVVREESNGLSASHLDEQLEELADNPPRLHVPGFWFPPSLSVPRKRRLAVAKIHPLLEDAFRILAIALAANHRQIPIRWFDTEKQPATSPKASPFLTVLNGEEVKHMARARLSLSGVINLTRANRLSLVLYSPPTEQAPGVLFCADSGLGGIALVADPGMIVTAPHHGAADPENVAAYQYLDATGTAASPPSWQFVRSDNWNAARPCQEYLARPLRFCTRCRGQKGRSQHVVFNGSRGGWSPHAAPCACI